MSRLYNREIIIFHTDIQILNVMFGVLSDPSLYLENVFLLQQRAAAYVVRGRDTKRVCCTSECARDYTCERSTGPPCRAG